VGKGKRGMVVCLSSEKREPGLYLPPAETKKTRRERKGKKRKKKKKKAGSWGAKRSECSIISKKNDQRKGKGGKKPRLFHRGKTGGRSRRRQICS